MSVYVMDNVLSQEWAQSIENIVRSMNYRWGGKSLSMSTNYYPLELPKGLKWGDWEPKSGPNYHWIKKFGHNENDLKKTGNEWCVQLWEQLFINCNLKEHFSIDEMIDCYVNVHTHGQAPHLHPDNGNFTLLYYPQLNWDHQNWGGGITIWERNIDGVENIDKLEVLQHVLYKGNRLVMFDGWHWHRTEPVARVCKEARYVVVYKTGKDGGNSERLGYYDN